MEKEMVESTKDEESGARETEPSSGNCTCHAARVGMALLGLGAISQVGGAVDMLHSRGGFLWLVFYVFGTPILVVGAFCFFVDSWIFRGCHRSRNIRCFLATILVLVVSWVILPIVASHIEGRRTVKTRRVILQLASEIEGIRSRTGHLPVDESEVVQLRRKAMPLSGWRRPIRYLSDPNGSRYWISSDYGMSYFLYDSRDANAGVRVDYW